jgi:hypothetical protein
VEWLKVKALSSNPSTAKRKKKRIVSKKQGESVLLPVPSTGQRTETRHILTILIMTPTKRYCGVVIAKWLIFSEKYLKERMLMEMGCPHKVHRLRDRCHRASRSQYWQKTGKQSRSACHPGREHLPV